MDKQGKPLRDWTLGEAQKVCRGCDEQCHGCPFTTDAGCRISGDTPNLWDLTDQPRFTEDEVAAMRVLYAAGVVKVERLIDETLVAWIDCRGKNLPPLMFPSILPGMSVELAKIINIKEG